MNQTKVNQPFIKFSTKCVTTYKNRYIQTYIRIILVLKHVFNLKLTKQNRKEFFIYKWITVNVLSEIPLADIIYDTENT